ncbi:MAG: TMEM175 family protein, partial [Clostridioides difficile]
MKINRIEAFTDAVVAIIMTIMVLEIKVPEIDSLKG